VKGVAWLLAAAATLCFVAASTVVGVRVWAEHYSPLDSVGFFGPELSSDPYIGPSDGETRYMHSTKGLSTIWLMGVRNSGGTAVVVDSVEPVGAAGAVTWSPYVSAPGGLISGQPERARKWPAHLAGHGVIRLTVTLNAARCQRHRAVLFDAVQVRWHVIGVHHSQLIRPNQSVQLCPTTASTKEWVRSAPNDAVPLP
jgi:hypothetical protein